MARFGHETTRKLKEFYMDNSTNAREIPFEESIPEEPGFLAKLKSIFSKQLDVAEKALDNKLIEMGESPESLKRLSVVHKKNLMVDKFSRESIESASASIAGLVPIQTKVIIDEKGDATVGVVGVASERTVQIAKDIAMQRESVVKGRARDNLMDLLPEGSEDFLSAHGVRLVYDKNGSPALLSFGIGSYVPNKSNNYLNQKLKNNAIESASMMANAQIAEMVNGHMSAERRNKVGEEIRQYVEREMRSDALTEEHMVTNIIDITNNNMTASASVSMRGISTLHQWAHKLENGPRFVGVVNVWRYSTLDAARAFDNPLHKKREEKKVEKKIMVDAVDTGIRIEPYSKKINTLDDF